MSLYKMRFQNCDSDVNDLLRLTHYFNAAADVTAEIVFTKSGVTMQRFLKLSVPAICSLCLPTVCGGNGGGDVEVDGDAGWFEGRVVDGEWPERLCSLI